MKIANFQIERRPSNLQFSIYNFQFAIPAMNDAAQRFWIASLDFLRCLILIGEPKKPNSSRSRFSRYRSYEKCSCAFGLRADVNTTKVGGFVAAWVMYSTRSGYLDRVVARGCSRWRSKKRFSSAVDILLLRSACVRRARSSSFVTRNPLFAETNAIGA